MAAARLLALDWGTSALRAYLLDGQGEVLDRGDKPWGIQRLPEGGFEAALRGIAGAWMRPGLPIIASGMVGSAQGWREAPYVACPAGAPALARSLLAFRAAGREQVHIVPGMVRVGERTDVMRGEETQVFGALRAAPRLAADSLLVLPGTHSKWVRVRDGCIVDFRTFMTGELFAVLGEHSILGRPAREAAGAATPPAAGAAGSEAFDRGVRAVFERRATGATELLFSTRALVLTRSLRAADSLDYLSGLLVGEELRCALQGSPQGCPMALIGEPALCARYRRAFAQWDRPEPPLVEGSAALGLWSVARLAGLLAAD